MVLGMLPLARELLRMGSEVVMVANSLPAINDVTCAELRTLLESVCEICPVLKVRLSSQRDAMCGHGLLKLEEQRTPQVHVMM